MRLEELAIETQMKVLNEIADALIECGLSHPSVYDAYVKLEELDESCEFKLDGSYIPHEELFPIDAIPCASLGTAIKEIRKEYDCIGCENFSDLVKFCENQGLMFTDIGEMWF